VIFVAKFESRSAAESRQEVVDAKDLSRAGKHFADAGESGRAESPGQETIEHPSPMSVFPLFVIKPKPPMVDGGETVSLLMRGKI
jgi:hypothetical protein